MKTRNLIAAARVGPVKPLLTEVAAQHGARQQSGLPWPICYYFESCMRPLELRYDLVLFIKTASALQSWSGGHCPARMAASMVALHRFDSPTLNAIKIAGILLLIVASLLGLAVGGFGFTRETHQARPDPLAFPINGKETLDFPAPASVAAVAVSGARLLRRRRQRHAPHFVSSLPARGPPAASGAVRLVPAIDSLLAATALHHDLRLVTPRNTRDFDDAGLEVINPWEIVAG